MKTKTIEVKFPTIEGMKVENASVDLKNGVSVVEYVEYAKFKKGDVIYCEHKTDGGSSWVAINDNLDEKGKGFTLCSVMITSNYDAEPKGYLSLNDSQSASLDVFRLATYSEKQLLFDALEKEGKYWDSESLEVKDIPKEEIIKNIFRELRGHNISVNEAYRRMHKLIPING